MHKPMKGSFTQIINAVADGKGVKLQGQNAAQPKDIVKASEPPKSKKP